MKPLAAYTDYRAYLRDILEERKRKRLPSSNRFVAQKVGMNSTSWLTLLLQGKRGLSKISTAKISRFLGHTPHQVRYFEALVEFNQAKTPEDRSFRFEALQGLSRIRDPELVRETQYGFYSAWYHSVIRSIIGMLPFRGDFDQLAGTVTPPITAQEAQKSLRLLMDLGLVIREPGGEYRLSASGITTGKKASAVQLPLYHQETIRLAIEAIDRHPMEEREISSLTIGIAPELYPLIKDILADARRRIAELAESAEMAKRVYQINMQFFPLSKIADGQDGAR